MLWVGVLAAGALGAVLRWKTGEWLITKDFPWATLTVNAFGGFFMGWVQAQTHWSMSLKIIFAVGLLGGFTTFSAFAWETVKLWHDGQGVLALVNFLANNIVAVGLCALAYSWARTS